MTPEEFQRIKEAEKEHLRKLKKLKEAVRVLERQKKISGAVTDMTSSMQDKMDEHREAMDKVALDAARTEARLEMAIEAADERAEAAAHEVRDEGALREHRAKELIRQMKAETAVGSRRVSSSGERSRSHEDHSGPESVSKDESESRDERPIPDKTIGRMKP